MERMDRTDWLLLIGRILIAVLFLPAGIEKLLHLQDTIASVAAAGMPLPNIAGPIGALIETIGPILLIVGFYTRFSAMVLILFTALATAYFHRYWELAGAERMAGQGNFWKNVAIGGGLLYVATIGAGRLSIDARRRTNR